MKNLKHFIFSSILLPLECVRSTAELPERKCPEPKACPSCEGNAPDKTVDTESITDVFSFANYQAVIVVHKGRCKVKFESFGDEGEEFQLDLDLRGPCYVSRWSSIVPRSERRDTMKAHGGPGDAQVWQFGIETESPIFVTTIMGFAPAMALPEDRSEKERRNRCSNAHQPIRFRRKNHFSLGDAWSSPKLRYCPLKTLELPRFAIYAEDLFPRKQD